jgi:ABC-type transport system involved in multi-copper enzyme maturation permease subunit
MSKLLSAEWLRIRRYRLTRVLLVLWIVILVLQVNAKLKRLEELEAKLAEPQPAGELTLFEQMMLDRDQLEASRLREDLRYPAFIGYAARLSTGFGWFLVILFTAVIVGEDFSQRTLRSILSRGAGRKSFLLTRCLALWLATGIGVGLIAVLSVIGGLYTHARVTADLISLAGFGEALFFVLRSWLATLPFIVATLFWTVLARQAGPAMGLGIGLHAYEFLNGFVLPAMADALARGAQLPLIFRWQVKLWSITLGYSADVFLNWGSPFLKSILTVTTPASLDFAGETILPTTPWRAVVILVGYTILFLGWAMWIIRRRDMTYRT